MKTILLVEDDAMIASGLMYALEQEGYAPRHCGTVAAARLALSEGRFDLAILDCQIPDGTGFDLVAPLRQANTALLFLTVVDEEGQIVRAFEQGAADYVTKPFRLRELLARVKRILNTANPAGAAAQPALTLGRAVIDQAAGRVCVDGAPLELTALEYRLLLVFANNRGRLLSRAQILERIWDVGGNYVEDNTLTVYIKRLREKLGDAAQIETVRGVGYRVDQ